jgi:MoxR-like ATPase
VELQEFSEKYRRTVDEVGRSVLGQSDVIEHVLIALIASGHILLEGVPGLGKTLLVRSLGAVLGLSFGRIQFTPDLMPSDVTGNNVFNAQKSAFEFIPGPVFHQLLLADEINRAPAKTQSSLLEAMQEGAVTVDGTTRTLPAPFLVLALRILSNRKAPIPCLRRSWTVFYSRSTSIIPVPRQKGSCFQPTWAASTHKNFSSLRC